MQLDGSHAGLAPAATGSRRRCEPTAVQEFLASEVFLAHGAEGAPERSEAVQAAMTAASGFLGSVPEPAPPQDAAFGHWCSLGHAVEREGRVFFALCVVPT